MINLDLLDKKILYELDLNARISASRLAKKLRKSKETVNFRINRLIKKGIIKGCYAVLNTSKLGFYYTKYYLKFRNITPEKESEFYSYVQKQPSLAYLGSVEGLYDCMILVMVKNSSDVVAFQDLLMNQFGEYIQEKEIVTFLTTHRLNQRFIYNGEEKKDHSYPLEIKNYEIDEIEKKILNLMSTNARITLIEIANKLKIDSKVVKYRLNKLEKDKIILGYVTSLDYNLLDLAFYQINISLTYSSIRREVVQFFNMTNKCIFAIELLGKYDVLVEVLVNNPAELKKMMDDLRVKFIGRYSDYDISTINKEYVMVWSPF